MSLDFHHFVMKRVVLGRKIVISRRFHEKKFGHLGKLNKACLIQFMYVYMSST